MSSQLLNGFRVQSLLTPERERERVTVREREIEQSAKREISMLHTRRRGAESDQYVFTAIERF